MPYKMPQTREACGGDTAPCLLSCRVSALRLMEDLMPFFFGALCSEPWLLVLLLGLFPGLS